MTARASGDTGLRFAWDVVRRRRWLALAAICLGLSAALSLALFLPDIYRATVTVLVDSQASAQAFPGAADPESVDARLQTISQVILSRARLRELIARFDLYPEQRGKASEEAMVERLRRDIGIEVKGVEQAWGRNAPISFALSYRGRDPLKTAAVANALADFYVQQNQELRQRQATQSTEALKGQLDEMKTRLDEQESRVADFKLRHTGELPQQTEANLATLQRLNGQLQLNSQNQMRAWERREKLAADPAAAGADAETTEARLARLRGELADLKRKYSDKYPDVVHLHNEIAGLEARQAEGGAGDGAHAKGGAAAAGAPPSALRVVDAEIARLKTEEASLRQTISQYEQRVERSPQRQQEFQELSRDYATTRDLYDSLLKKYEEARLAEGMEHGQTTGQFRILDAAMPPRDPAAPNRPWIAAMGLILALGLAAGAMALAEQLDGSFHSKDDLRGFTRIPVLGSIPPIRTRSGQRRARLRACLYASSLLFGMALIAGAAWAVAHRFEQIAAILSRVRV